MISTKELLMTDFSFHSIGVIFHRLKRHSEFLTFVQDVLIDGAIAVVALTPFDMYRVNEIMGTYRLDFDDAYQYVAMERTQAQLDIIENVIYLYTMFLLYGDVCLGTILLNNVHGISLH